jgi:fibronectin type 3 domain-containing protein
MKISRNVVMTVSFSILVFCPLAIFARLSVSDALEITTVSLASCPRPSAPVAVFPKNGATGISTDPTLSWAPGSNADSYDVYFGTTSSPPFVGNTTGTSYPWSGLSYGTSYYWKVVAKNGCGSSTSGSLWRFTTKSCPAPGVPSRPFPASWSTGVPISPTLSWTDMSSDSYEVYFGTSSNPPLVTITSSTTYSPSTLSCNTYYYWKIVAKNSCNKSTAGPRWVFRTASPGITAPSIPSGLTATSINCNEVNLSWSASKDTAGSGLKGYNVYRNGSYLKQVLSPSTSTSDTGLAGSALYSYVVSSIDNAGNESAMSNMASAATSACPDTSTPSMPAPLTASAASCSQINLIWGASTDTGGSGLKGYNVYRNGSYLKQVLSPSTSTSDTGLAGSTLYSYVVSSVDNAGNESAMSNMAAANTAACPDITPPSVPARLIATAVSSSQINLSWDPSTDIGGTGPAEYKIYRGGNQIGTATCPAYSDSELAANTQYCYTVAACDTAGNTSGTSTEACAITGNLPSGGQTVWAERLGGAQNDVGYSVAVDSGSNIITTGIFTGTADLGAGFVTSLGAADMYIAKYSPSGTYQWAIHFGGAGASITPQAVAVDRGDNVLVTGTFTGTVDFGGGPKTSAYHADLFVAKYSSSGAYLWAKSYADGGQAVGYSVAADSVGNVVVGGTFLAYIDFADIPNYTGPTFITGYGHPSAFLAKLSPSGTFLWAKGLLNSGSNEAYGIAVDKNDNILMTGYFVGVVDFGGGLLSSTVGGDIFLAKYSPLGVYQWVNAFGAMGGGTGYGVAVDHSNNTVITGFFTGTVDFGSGPVTSVGQDIFVAKYSTSGSLLWERHAGSPSGASSRSISVDDSGNVTVTGHFSGAIDFGGGSMSGGENTNIFVAQYSSSGADLWSRVFTEGTGLGVAADGSGDAIVTGYFCGTTDFGGLILTSVWNDIFLLKISP